MNRTLSIGKQKGWNLKKKDQKYDLLLEDLKKLGLENEKLKKGMKGKASNLSKKMKVNEDKKTKELQKRWKL